MPVPEAAMDEYDGLVLGKDEIRLSRQACFVKAKPEALTVNPRSDQHFGLGVATPNARHHPTPRRLVDDIRQEALSDLR
jgi:hypothetical protein